MPILRKNKESVFTSIYYMVYTHLKPRGYKVDLFKRKQTNHRLPTWLDDAMRERAQENKEAGKKDKTTATDIIEKAVIKAEKFKPPKVLNKRKIKTLSSLLRRQ